MAINIDSVYQKVLALTNKEQRGYITPQEFTLLANQAQMEIFEQYFYDMEYWGKRTGSEYENSDLVTGLEEKISLFQVWDTTGTSTNVSNGWAVTFDNLGVNSDVYKLTNVYVQYANDPSLSYNKAEKVTIAELNKYEDSPLLKSTFKRPYYILSQGKFYIHPEATNADNVKYSYIRKPAKVSWGYVVVAGKALFDPDTNKTTHFELHASESVELVYKILKLAGVTIQKNDIVQIGQSMEAAKIQQEKQ